MADEPMVEVLFSEVHWYQVKVPQSALNEAAGGWAGLGLTGPLDSKPDAVFAAVSELLGAAAADQDRSLVKTDGLEVGSVTLVS